MNKLFVVSWYTDAAYAFVAAYRDGQEANRTVKVLEKLFPPSGDKKFRVEEVEVVDDPA